MRAPRFMHQHRFDLAADALLISSGLFSLVTSVALCLMWLFGVFEPGSAADQALSDSPLAAALSLVMLFTGAVLGPALAWRLHGYTLRWRHLIALLGAPVVFGAVSVIVPLAAAALQFALRPVTDWEFAGPVALLVLVAIPYFMILWHATRDAMAPAGDPPALERLRLLSITSLMVLVFVVAGALALGLTGELGDALVFTMLIGYAGAVTATTAAALDARLQPRK